MPVRSGGWWYYTRTFEGSQYAAHCRAPVSAHPARPQPEPGTDVAGEQVMLDGNVEAEGHEFFSLGALTVSADHRWLGYAVDTEGNERFALRIKDLDSGDIVDEAVTEIGYGCAFSLDARHVFYTRVDEAWRPHQVWRHEVGTPADAGRAGLRGGRPAVLDGCRQLARRPLAHDRDRFQDHLGGAAARRSGPDRGVPRRGRPPRGCGVRGRARQGPPPHRPQHRQPRLRPRVGAAGLHVARAVAAPAEGTAGRAIPGDRRLRHLRGAVAAQGRPDRTAPAAPRRERRLRASATATTFRSTSPSTRWASATTPRATPSPSRSSSSRW